MTNSSLSNSAEISQGVFEQVAEGFQAALWGYAEGKLPWVSVVAAHRNLVEANDSRRTRRRRGNLATGEGVGSR